MKAFFLCGVMILSCTENGPKPEDPVWGKQQCAHCSMLVSEKEPSAQLLSEGRKRYFFDDLGCLVAWEDREHPQVLARWVRGPQGVGWVDPMSTLFSSGHATPMDFGFWADTQGIDFEHMRQTVREKAKRLTGEKQ